MTYTHYADVMPDGTVRACFPWSGPPVAFDSALGEPVLIEGPIDWRGPTPTSVLYHLDGAFAWIETATLTQLRAAKIESMRAACEAQIIGGFMCEALGLPYLYPAKAQDQSNLVASVTDSLLAGADPAWVTPFWCMDATGLWEFRPHTIAQIQQVGREAKIAILSAMGKNEALRQQIDAASAEQLAEINW